MPSDLHPGFACTVCGQRHELPLQYSVNAPQAVLAVQPEERDRRIVMTPDQCVIDGRDFYLRGRILLPIVDSLEPFVWGVWAEVSPKSFLRANELWNTPGREKEPLFQGWLNTDIFLFGSTINLEVNVQTQPVGERPQFTIRDSSHPLAIEQRNGITLERAEEIAEMILHHGEPD